MKRNFLYNVRHETEEPSPYSAQRKYVIREDKKFDFLIYRLFS